jgi:tellurite resistance protein
MLGDLIESISGVLEGFDNPGSGEASDDTQRENDALVEVLIQVALADGAIAPGERAQLAAIFGERFASGQFRRFAGKDLDAAIAEVASGPVPVARLVSAVRTSEHRRDLACAAYLLSRADSKVDEREAAFLRELLAALKLSAEDLKQTYESWQRSAWKNKHPGFLRRVARHPIIQRAKTVAVYGAIGAFAVLAIASSVGQLKLVWNGTRVYDVSAADTRGTALIEAYKIKAVLTGAYGILGTVIFAKNPVEIAAIKSSEGKSISYATVKPEVVASFGLRADRDLWDLHGRWVLLSLMVFLAAGFLKGRLSSDHKR